MLYTWGSDVECEFCCTHGGVILRVSSVVHMGE